MDTVVDLLGNNRKQSTKIKNCTKKISISRGIVNKPILKYTIGKLKQQQDHDAYTDAPTLMQAAPVL